MNLTSSISTVSKAIAGFIAGGIVMFLAKHNIVIADDLNDALEIIIGAIITGVVVYFAPKNKEAQR